MPDPVVGILGTGLIGASIGLGLSDVGWDVIGWDPSRDALDVAWERGAVTERANSRADLVSRELDLLVLAGPPGAITRSLSGLDTDTLVTDVAGVKSQVLSAGAHLQHYVPSHPMAGRETNGAASATRSLFRGASWIVVTDATDPEDVTRVEQIVRTLGANPVQMTAKEHDRTVAVVSQLPQVLASTLIAEAGEEVTDLSLVGGSFRDLTRVAGSDAHLWSELLTANRQIVTDAIERFGRRLQRWAELLDARQDDSIVAALAKSGRVHATLHSPSGRVDVSLEDRPGELAAIGRALERCAVDVRDLQLRHSPYGGGGLLQLFVKDHDMAALCSALTDEGLAASKGRDR